jgi:hypothetical protein
MGRPLGMEGIEASNGSVPLGEPGLRKRGRDDVHG